MDSDIDYSKFSREELDEALKRINKQRFPQNYANLLKESDGRPYIHASHSALLRDLSPGYGTRIAAALLFVGGVIGTCISLSLAFNALRYHWPLIFMALPGIALFGWSTIVGSRLWRGAPAGVKWAKLLFLLQIPVPRPHYWRYEIRVLHGNRCACTARARRNKTLLPCWSELSD
jgi:hypothetical protein